MRDILSPIIDAEFFGPWKNTKWTNNDSLVSEMFNRAFSKSGISNSYLDKDNNKVIEIAVPGFTREELEITHSESGILKIVSVKKADEKKNPLIQYDLEVSYQLDPSEVVESADLRNGLLSIRIKRPSKTTKKVIEIQSESSTTKPVLLQE